MGNEHFEAIKHLTDLHGNEHPVGIILGTGLGGLVKDIKIKDAIDYSEIPNFPVSTVESHHGKLIFGKLSGKNIIAMQGRFHFYEGYSMKHVTFPVYVLKSLGVKTLIVSNACGALNPKFRKTELMIMTSHINFLFDNPLRGIYLKPARKATGNNIKDDKIKDPSVSRKNFYDKELIKLAEKVAMENGIRVQKGTYVPVQGPNLETVAEYRMIRKIGGDTVGMSTIPEVIVANGLGMKVLGLSIITDEGFPDTLRVALLKDILESASVAEPKLTLLIKKLVKEL